MTPAPAQVAVELVGGPRCGADDVAAPIGPRGDPPPVIFVDGVAAGHYYRSERLVTKPTGALRVAYDWREVSCP